MKNTTLKRIFCILMAVMLFLSVFSVLALATGAEDGAAKKITSQPTGTNPTVETNKNNDIIKYSWYKILLSNYYRLVQNDKIIDGQNIVEVIFEGHYLDGKWMSDYGYINIGVTAIGGDIVKVTFIEGFDGYAYLYEGVDLTEQDDGSYIYTVTDEGYVDLVICNDNDEPIEAIVEIVRDGESYPVIDKFDFTNKKYYPIDVDDGYYDGGKWISTEEGGKQEIDIEFYLEAGYTAKITLNDGFVGTALICSMSTDENYELEIVDGVITYVTDGENKNFEIRIKSDYDCTAEITLTKDDIEFEVVDDVWYDNEKMTYFSDDIYAGIYADGVWTSNGEGDVDFYVHLLKGSFITFKPSDNFDGELVLYDIIEEKEIQLKPENGEYTCEVTKGGLFSVYMHFDEQYTVEIFVRTKEAQLVEGQTEKTLKSSEMGSYYVEVEFEDGTVLTSNIFEIHSTVIFNTNGGTPLDNLSVVALTEIGKTEREGFVLDGWYLNKELTEKAELPLDILGTVNLYAKWIKCDHKNSTNKPTCTESVECTVCKADYNATGHSYNSSYIASSDKHYLECSVCGAKQSEGNHSFGEWRVTKYAEGKTQGEEKRACTVCGHTESRAIEALDGLSDGAIVGIIIGSGALLALLTIGLWFLLKKRK